MTARNNQTVYEIMTYFEFEKDAIYSHELVLLVFFFQEHLTPCNVGTFKCQQDNSIKQSMIL
jgi:hypothetical protein